MPTLILMPALSPTMTEGTVSKWLKAEGDRLKAGQVIAEIETDKATMEVEAVDEGILVKILVPAGTHGVKVNECIAVLQEEGEDAAAVSHFLSNHQAGGAAPAMTAASVEPALGLCQEQDLLPHTPSQGHSHQPLAHSMEISLERTLASPLARRMALQGNLDLADMEGSGPRGRIIKMDVERALLSPQKSSARKSTASGVASGDGLPAYQAYPLSGMRKVIAQRLTLSKQTIPHFYLTMAVEMDALFQLRHSINGSISQDPAQDSVKVSVNDLLIRGSALAFRAVPEANAAWADTEIRQYETADVSVAIAVEGGLVTPVVRQADGLSVLEISQEMKRLATAARQGKLTPEDWTGGTFTLSNLGMYGIQEFGAILNPPQACILAVGASEKQLKVRADDTTEIATLMNGTLSADHRVVDGVVGARLLQVFRDLIQAPLRLLL